MHPIAARCQQALPEWFFGASVRNGDDIGGSNCAEHDAQQRGAGAKSVAQHSSHGARRKVREPRPGPLGPNALALCSPLAPATPAEPAILTSRWPIQASANAVWQCWVDTEIRPV